MYNKLLTEKILFIFYLHLKAFKLNINKKHPVLYIAIGAVVGIILQMGNVSL